MRFRIPRGLRLAILCVAMVAANELSAQQVINVEQANITGTLLRYSPLGATIGTPLGPYEVDLVNREFKDLGPARVEVKGEKPREFLKPGMTVRFEAEIVNKRTIRDPLAEVTVIDPTAVVAMRGGGDAAGAAKGKELIVGRVRTFRRGVMSLEVPGERKPIVMQAKLTDDAVIKISVNNLSAATPGDKVHVKGWKEIGGRLKRIWAQELTVTPAGKPVDARLAAGNAKPPAGRPRTFGEVPAEDKPPGKDAKYKGVILEIN